MSSTIQSTPSNGNTNSPYYSTSNGTDSSGGGYQPGDIVMSEADAFRTIRDFQIEYETGAIKDTQL